ncbi:hypothetical protein C9374_010867 [Naegleria lovaniensis]|uniref:Proteasome activator complex subunit 4 n=1 Tax=Naegleria lovaniensis TaxID=51637 RepID=A0AA88GAR9_NAELO|nr:uncharacterized protein C9374_010867 [Naegleria lovaniensis]KAG2374297.1 hypothetical protein C9374_010867 [Naegleria lovaniensis]
MSSQNASSSSSLHQQGGDVQRLRYSSQLPSLVRDGISEEIESWKNDIIIGFQKALSLLHQVQTNNSASSEEEEGSESIHPKWFHTLNSTIRLFNRYSTNLAYPLSLQDRVTLFETLLPIMIDKQLDSYMELQTKLANVMLFLMKNKYHKLIHQSIKPITCWRRFYEMLRNTYFPKNRNIAYHPSENFGKTIVKLVCKLRNNFSVETTDEVISELSPSLYFSDSEFFVSQAFLCLFLPSNPEVSTLTNHWFTQLLAMWDWNTNSPFYDLNFVSLMYRLAKDQAGRIDFKPHLDQIFTRLIRSMDLNIGSGLTSSSVASGAASKLMSKNLTMMSNAASGIMQVLSSSSGGSTYHSFPSNNCSIFWKLSDLRNLLMQYNAQLLTWLITPSSPETLIYLKRLFQSIDQYYYPSNNGEWSRPLSIFISELFRSIAARVTCEREQLVSTVTCEREQLVSGVLSGSCSYQLDDETIEEIIRIVFPSCKMALFSKSEKVSKNAIQAIKHISFIRPSAIVKELFEIVFHALQTLTEVHQISVALELLNTIIIPLLYHNIPEVKDYMAELLNMALLGIDTNDQQKTSLTISFLNTLFSVVPIISTMSYHEGMPHVVELFPDFVSEFIRRILHVMGELVHTKQQHTEAKKEKKEVYNHLSKSISLFFQQLSQDLHQVCVLKIIEYLTSEFKPNSVKHIGEIAQACVIYLDQENGSYDPLGMMIDALMSKILYKNELRDLHEQEMDYYIHLLAKIVKCNACVGKHLDSLLRVIRLTFDHESKAVVKSCGKLLKNILQSLSQVYLVEKRSAPPKQWFSEEFQNNHDKYWGQLYDSTNVDAQWHVPNDREVEQATQIYNEFVKGPVVTVQKATSMLVSLNKRQEPSEVITRDELLRALLKFKYLLKGSSLMLDEIRRNEKSEYTKKLVNHFSNKSAGCMVIADEKLEMNREALLTTLHTLLKESLAVGLPLKEDVSKPAMVDVRVLIALTKAIHICAAFRSLSFSKMLSMSKIWSLLKLHFFKSTTKKKYPRCFILDRCQLLFTCRVFQRTIPCTEIHLETLESLKRLSTDSEYSQVRTRAQTAFIGILKLFNHRAFEKFILPIIDTLQSKDSTHAMVNGSIFLLEKSTVIRRITDSWQLISKMLPSICNCYHVDKSSIQKRIYGLYMQYSTSFKELPIHNKTALKYYHDTVSSLVSIASSLSQSFYWNYQLITVSCLNLLIRSDRVVLLPMEAVKCFMTNLVSDHVPLRLLCMKAVDFIFTQYKPIQPRQVITDKEQVKSIIYHSSQVPTSQEEFEKTYFVDKYYVGWNGLPNKVIVYDYSKERLFREESLELQQVIASTMLEPNYLTKLFMYFSEETNTQNNGRSFTKKNAQMFKGLFQLMGIQALELLKPFIEDLLSVSGSGAPEEHSKICLVAEIFAGLSRATKHWKFDDKQNALEYLLQQISHTIDTCAPQAVDSGLRSAFHYAMFDSDGRRTRSIINFLIEKTNLDSGIVSVQVKVLQLVFFTLVELDWRDTKILEKFIEEKLLNHLAYPYQQIRELISRNLALIFLKSWNPSRDENGLPKLVKSCQVNPILSQLLKSDMITTTQSISQNLFMDETGALKLPPFLFSLSSLGNNLNPSEFIQKTMIPKLHADFEKLYSDYSKQRSLEQSESSQKTKLSPEEIAFKSLCKTVVEFMGASLMFGINVTLPYFSSLLPLVLQCFTSSNDTDIAIISAGVIARVGSYLLPQHTIKDLLFSILFLQKQLMIHQASASTRRVRLAICFFLQRFAFKHQFYIIGTEIEDDFYEHLLFLLKDKFVEVRDIACNTLAGFIKIAPDARVKRIVDHFLEESKQHFAHKKSGQAEKISKLDANYIAIGLSAIVKAYPYSLPSFVPTVLVTLSKFSSYQKSEQENVDVQFLTETIKHTFTQFHKTHHEQWEEYKKQFTEDELYTVNQLLYSPVYYA